MSHLAAHDWDALGKPPRAAGSYAVGDLLVDVETFIERAKDADREAEYADDRARDYEDEAEEYRVAAKSARQAATALIKERITDEYERGVMLNRYDLPWTDES